MGFNSFHILLRILWRNKLTTFINILGLALGISSCLLIYLYVENEWSFDQHHSKKDRIYRVSSEITLTNQTDKFGYSSFLLGPTLKEDYPEIEEAIRLRPVRQQTMWVDNKPFQFSDNFMTDPGFFHLFDYEFLEGNPKTALVEPGSVVITDEVAIQLFGSSKNVLGKTIDYIRRPYQVTGVVKDRKDNSHLYFHTILSISSMPPELVANLKSDWFYMMQANYILFKKPENGNGFEKKLASFKDKHINPWLKENALQGNIKFHLQPLTSLHFSSEFSDWYSKTGEAAYIYIFICVAIFILLIACINYLNLATATATKRAKEIGIRKTVGANSVQLFRQFMAESILISILAIALAMLLTFFSLPLFNGLAGKSLHFPFSISFLLVLVVFWVFTGILAGGYPALFLSRLPPLTVFKNFKISGGSGFNIRRVLVGFQFFISAGFIFCTLVVFSQIYLMKNADLGFEKEQIMVVRVPQADSSLMNRYEVVKQELTQHPDVISVASTSAIPSELSGKLLHFIETPDHIKTEKTLNIMLVSHDFLDILGMKLVQGRNFSKDFKNDDTAAFLINETGLKYLGWKDPYSPTISNGFGYNGHLIGVVKDFSYFSLQQSIEPLVIVLEKNIGGNLLIKIRKGKEAETALFINETWKKYSRKYPIESFFLDDKFNQFYQAEEKMLTLFGLFSGLNIFISCMGLFALITFSLEQKVKEIGIRKVLGASIPQIIMITSKEFLLLIGIAALLSFPIASWAMNKWLEDFATRSPIQWWMFAISGSFALLIAFFTLLIKVIPASRTNPAYSLRTE